jgi:hypothetical protein
MFSASARVGASSVRRAGVLTGLPSSNIAKDALSSPLCEACACA